MTTKRKKTICWFIDVWGFVRGSYTPLNGPYTLTLCVLFDHEAPPAYDEHKKIVWYVRGNRVIVDQELTDIVNSWLPDAKNKFINDHG